MKYPKWRDLEINPFDIKFNNIVIEKIINYYPAGNDVIEVICNINNVKQNCIIKIERSKMADFDSEIKNIKIIKYNLFYNQVPNIVEYGSINNKIYIVLEKIQGRRLSEIFKRSIKFKDEYLRKYGIELGKIHKIPIEKFKNAKQRAINVMPDLSLIKNKDEYILNLINYLSDNKPIVNNNTFIHGDFHYANILWKNKKINGVIDYEYSGKGFKEQDIAWALVLRPSQEFMNNIDDILLFLEGYKLVGNYDSEELKWCLLNAYAHFYLMNINDQNYIKKIKQLICLVKGNNLL